MMATVDMSVKLAASAAEVWEVVGDFLNLDKWHPAVEKSETIGEGGIRRLTSGGGGPTFDEVQLERDEDSRRMRYAILGKPFPLENYSSWLSVEDTDGGCVVRWRSAFSPDQGSETKANGIVQFIYKGGFDALVARFGAA
ncbi:SRPBCC family protein [Nisaea sp.]|uniref:SRPBCC family protein n=2 Tax=Nisaea sp. TaxID=2024842 RepID=UPI003266FE1F